MCSALIHVHLNRVTLSRHLTNIAIDTCSSGAVGSLAVGLGTADIAMSVITGETWFKVPECKNIRFVGQPQLGIGGKDIILYILGELKRNTVAADRVVGRDSFHDEQPTPTANSLVIVKMFLNTVGNEPPDRTCYRCREIKESYVETINLA